MYQVACANSAAMRATASCPVCWPTGPSACTPIIALWVLHPLWLACRFVQILLALWHVHGKNVLHRDLKLSNIFMSQGEGSCSATDRSIGCPPVLLAWPVLQRMSLWDNCSDPLCRRGAQAGGFWHCPGALHRVPAGPHHCEPGRCMHVSGRAFRLVPSAVTEASLRPLLIPKASQLLGCCCASACNAQQLTPCEDSAGWHTLLPVPRSL